MYFKHTFIFYIRTKWYKVKYLLYRYLIKPTEPIRSIYGILLSPNLKDKTFKLYYKGSYGRFFSSLVMQYSQKAVFLDIGANQGLYSILAGKNKNFEHIVSFEPSKKTAALLKKTLEINTIKDYQIVEAAISNHNGGLKLMVDENHSGKSTLREKLRILPVIMTISTIDHTVINSIVPKNTNYVVKIDVEGHEEIVINELIKSSFFEKVQLLFCEVDEKWIQSERLIVTLATAGLEVVEKIEKILFTL